MDRGAWWATVHGVTESQTQLCMHACILSKTLPNIFLFELNVTMLYHLSSFKRKTWTSQCMSFRERQSLAARNLCLQPWMKRMQSVTRITIILSCEFLIWPRKRYPRPSHNLLMTLSTLKCQVLILATLPLRGISSLMRNMGCHLHPRTCDTGEALSPPTWNLLHIKHTEVK